MSADPAPPQKANLTGGIPLDTLEEDRLSRYFPGERLLAVATIGQDAETLAAEVLLEAAARE